MTKHTLVVEFQLEKILKTRDTEAYPGRLISTRENYEGRE